MQRLSTLLAAWPSGDSCSCQSRLDQIRQALHQFTGSVQAVDDQTAMMIQLTKNSDRGASLP